MISPLYTMTRARPLNRVRRARRRVPTTAPTPIAPISNPKPRDPREQASPWEDLKDGFRYAWGHSAVRRVLRTSNPTA